MQRVQTTITVSPRNDSTTLASIASCTTGRSVEKKVQWCDKIQGSDIQYCRRSCRACISSNIMSQLQNQLYEPYRRHRKFSSHSTGPSATAHCAWRVCSSKSQKPHVTFYFLLLSFRGILVEKLADAGSYHPTRALSVYGCCFLPMEGPPSLR